MFFMFLPFLFYFTAIDKNQRAVCHIARYWSKATIWFSFIFPLVEYEQKIDKEKTYIFCANHVSALDIPLILSVINMPIQYIGKAEISKIPLFGFFFKKNSVVVNRKNKRDSYDAFLNAKKRLDCGINMCIFPEGGIPNPNIFLKNFKNGPFRLAVEQEVSIIPISLPDNKKLFPQEYFKGYPGFVKIKVHSAINPKNFNNSFQEIKEITYNTIFAQLKKHEKKNKSK